MTAPVVCPTCSTYIRPDQRCPKELGLGQCMELAGHSGWHWSDVGHGDGSVLIWTGEYSRFSCPGRMSLHNWCQFPAGHDGLHNDGHGCSFGDPEPLP